MRWATLVSIAVVTLARPAHGDPTADEQAAARLLFYEGRKLAQAGDYAAACPKFERSLELDPGAGTLFNLADCWEHTGRTASAWSGFRDVAIQSAAANRPDREAEARRRASDLEPKLCRLTIRVADGQPQGIEVRRNDAVVPRSVWGASVPLDPGKHVVSAGARGYGSFSTEAVLDTPGATVTIDVPRLQPEPGVVAGSPTPAPASAPNNAAATSRPWQRPLAIGVGAVGVIGLAAGTVLGLVAKGKKDDSNTDGHCQGNACDEVGFPLREDAVTLGNAGTVVFIAGAILAAGGAVLWFTAPSAPSAPSTPTPKPSAQLRLGLGPTGLSIRGNL